MFSTLHDKGTILGCINIYFPALKLAEWVQIGTFHSVVRYIGIANYSALSEWTRTFSMLMQLLLLLQYFIIFNYLFKHMQSFVGLLRVPK